MKQRFYQCKTCGNIVTKVKDSGMEVACCGETMEEMIPGSVDAAHEKHVPVWTVLAGQVQVSVGAAAHPMAPEHFIVWIALQTRQGFQCKMLHSGEKPEACFALYPGDEVEAVYAYCNLHGLWEA